MLRDEVGGAGRARPAAVQHEQRRALADLYDEDVAAGCPDDPAARRLDGRNGIPCLFSPSDLDAITSDGEQYDINVIMMQVSV